MLIAAHHVGWWTTMLLRMDKVVGDLFLEGRDNAATSS